MKKIISPFVSGRQEILTACPGPGEIAEANIRRDPAIAVILMTSFSRCLTGFHAFRKSILFISDEIVTRHNGEAG